MGQKVHPYGFRLGYTKPWKSRWFVERDYDKLLLEDVKLRNELKDKLKSAGVSSIEIERPGNKLRVIIKTARPGIIIGRKGAEIDKLKQDVQKRTAREVYIDIQEVHKPELDAQLVSESIALQLEKRVGFRRILHTDAFHLKQNLAGFYHRDPVVRCAFTLTHTGFSRLLGHWLVRKQTDLNLAATLDKAGHGHPGRLDLAVGNPARLKHLQSVVAESQLTPAPRLPRHAPALLLSVLHFFGHQHKISS